MKRIMLIKRKTNPPNPRFIVEDPASDGKFWNRRKGWLTSAIAIVIMAEHSIVLLTDFQGCF